MNYLKEMNAFLDQIELEELSVSASMLWITLMHFNNKVGWKKEFSVPTEALIIKARITRSSFKRARTELKEKGYIKHTFINRNRAPVYEMISCVNHGVSQEMNHEMDPGVSRGTDVGAGPLIKRNNKKRKEMNDEADAAYLNPHEFYEQNIGILNAFIAEQITEWCEELSDELVIESMQRALQHNKPFFKYCEGILRRWHAAGINTLEAVAAQDHRSALKDTKEKADDIFEEIRKERQS
ncbi:DnaD domain-containing protein [Halobacillus litoralis]|uniref:DnaD domain-containing protein n=1 Tax=Halobacillus litoralis TaxID=45668 RepID=UPI001CFCFDB7|nr:DnaD domain protein [Halobacillus litoralis]